MGFYVPNMSEDQREMLKEIGFNSFEALSSHIPQDVHVRGGLKLPEGSSGTEVIGRMEEITQQDVVFKHIFRGAGTYSHYISVIVKSVVSKEEFPTSYTSYQAEINQDILQSIFEYQIILYELTDMDVSSVFVYGGAMVVAEVAAICRDRKRSKVYPSTTTHPQVTEVTKTRCLGSGAQAAMVPEKDGVTDTNALRGLLDDTVFCFYVQQPSYYGNLGECGLLEEIIREKGAKYIMGYNPISLALLSTPAECSADIAIDDGQPPDMSLCFGGPHLSLMTATSAMGRKPPGRIVGETRSVDGKKAYVLTLQAREQHIRREEASSNVRSNQALCALAAGIYMAAMGGEGLGKAAVLCTSKTYYLREQLEQAGFTARYDRESFHKLVTEGDTDSGPILKTLEEKGILRGLSLNDREIPWCATEQSRKGDMDQVIQIVKEVYRGQS